MFLLFMMLIGFPAVSWYYLNGGLDYRVNAKNELKNYGNIRQLSLTSLDDKQVFTDSLSVYLLQTNRSFEIVCYCLWRNKQQDCHSV